jgi:hypothetical protein
MPRCDARLGDYGEQLLGAVGDVLRLEVTDKNKRKFIASDACDGIVIADAAEQPRRDDLQ